MKEDQPVYLSHGQFKFVNKTISHLKVGMEHGSINTYFVCIASIDLSTSLFGLSFFHSRRLK